MSGDFEGFEDETQDAMGQASAPLLGFRGWVWGLLTLVLGVLLVYWLAGRQQHRADSVRDARLSTLADSSQAALVARLHAGEMLLRSVQTVFIASDRVSAAEFAVVYRNLRVRSEFPSLQALVYATREVRADGEHFVTALYAPGTGNARLRGLDVASQPGNLAALLRSRDTDAVMMSAPFPLVQGGQGALKTDGVVMRLPIFSSGPPPATVEARQRRIIGSLAASLRIRDLIAGVIPEAATSSMEVRVSDVGGRTPRLLYQSSRLSAGHSTSQRAPLLHAPLLRDVHFGRRHWRLEMWPLPAEDAMLDWQQSVFLPGLVASLLLALLVWSVAGTRRRALQLGVRMSQRYRDSEQRFRTLNDLLPALVVMANPQDGRVLYANQAACARLGERLAQGGRLPALFDDDSMQHRLRAMDGDAEWSNVEAMLVSVNGDRFWAVTSIAKVVFGDSERVLMVASDISEQRQLTEMLGYQATHDALTELYNRREFERHLQRALQALAKGGPPCALLYIDLDQFKLINDTSGHLAGDQLLSQLALVMAEQLRGGDVLARLGGDEFGVLACDNDIDGALVLAERLRARIDGYVYVWELRSYTISASIGVVMIDRAEQTLGEVLAQADSACYMAKDHGRNRVHFYSEQDDETVRRRGEMEWAHRLRWVIEEKRLLLDYQEVHPLQSDGESADGPHVELLLRLRDEQGRVVMPGAFLPAAERYGMVAQLDRWVIAEAITHFDRLHASGRAPGRCSLNLSAATLEDDDLADYLLGLIEQHAITPSRLCFEITETVAVRNLAHAVRFIERLRAVGCQVALDDFGAGMSSFGYLKNLPVDVIKIDGSFIRDLGVDPMSRSIVDAITQIGHQLGLEVVAEWVSSEDIVDTLRALGVDYGQGFALHQPERVLYQRDLE